MKRLTRRELNPCLLLERLNHVIPLPWRFEVHNEFFAVLALGVVLHDRASAVEVLDHTLEKILCDFHEVIHVCVGHVELAKSELRVMGQINAFVPEDTPNLVDAVKPTDGELLQVQLRRYTEVQVQIQIIVMRYERARSGTTCDYARHGRLDLKKSEIVKVAAEVIDHTCAGDEDVACTGRHDEIEIALAITGLLVFETEVSGWKLVQVWCEEDHARRGNAELALLAPRGVTGDTNDVTAPEKRLCGQELIRVFRITVTSQGIFAVSLDVSHRTLARICTCVPSPWRS